jgi:hypothetical protein
MKQALTKRNRRKIQANDTKILKNMDQRTSSGIRKEIFVEFIEWAYEMIHNMEVQLHNKHQEEIKQPPKKERERGGEEEENCVKTAETGGFSSISR